MINPKDVESIENAKETLGEEFVKEFTNGKGDDENGSNTEVH